MKRQVLLYLICEKVKTYISSDFNVFTKDFHALTPFKRMRYNVYFIKLAAHLNFTLSMHLLHYLSTINVQINENKYIFSITISYL